jgi:hypothetical protein
MPDASSNSSVSGLSADQDALLTQLVSGPSIREVATRVLQPALKTLYPNLNIDPRLAMVVTPSWMLDGEKVIAGPRHYESLTDALVRHGVAATTVLYLDGESYLTLQPQVPTPAQLPVSIDAIGRLLNELGPLLFVAFQEQQVDYWNQSTLTSPSRWQELSTSLRKLWNIGTDSKWNNDLSAMARNLFAYPDKHARATHDHYQSKACLIDLDSLDEGVLTHLNLLDMAVLIGESADLPLILSHSITQGFRSYSSLKELGESLLSYTDGTSAGKTLQWRLVEPEGNYFDRLACNLIALQADSIADLQNDTSRPVADLAPHISRSSSELEPTETPRPSRSNRVEQALPDWMSNAASSDLSAYSRHLMDLVAAQDQNAGKSFQDGIKPIRDFALEKLLAAMLEQHADAKDLKLQDLEITVDSATVWGSFVPPVEPERTRLSLVDLALQNLIALPLGNKSVRNTGGAPLPEWMTVSYLEAVISKIDIGQSYPALIKRTLLDDAEESLRRQQLFTRQLRVQLPLLALQNKLREQGDIDEQGYRYVAAVVQASEGDQRVDDEEIVIRPLALAPGWRLKAAADEVVNMFVIGPRQMDKGPCLLYRPLLDHPLIQYPTPANLIYAIKHSPTLRQSVLAWLPEGVRADYANYVLTGDRPSVWSISQLLADPLTSLQMSGTLSLGSQVITGDYMAALFKANANALIELAHRQSVSNAQYRWATFKQAAWMIFNAVLPFLGRTVGTTAWIWQIMDDLQEGQDAGEAGDTGKQREAMTDLLLTLAMALAHHASTRGSPVRRLPEKKPSATVSETESKAVARPARLVQLPDIIGEQPPAQHRNAVSTEAVLGLTKTLDRLKISKPEHLEPPADARAPYGHLYCLEQRYYAPVGERWFEVMVDDSGDVSIINTQEQPHRSGPPLIHNKRGEWFVDTRLRLRGGGLPSRRKALQQQNRERVAELKRQLAEFSHSRERTRTELTASYNTLKAASDTAKSAPRQQFLELLDKRTVDYAAPIEQLKALNLLEAVPNYRSSMVEMLGTRLFFNQTWFDQQSTLFAQTLKDALVALEAEESTGIAGDPELYRKMMSLNENMISKIEFAHSQFLELGRLGRSAAETASTYKAKLPVYSIEDLKALQVSLAREVCLVQGDNPGLNYAKAVFGRLLDTTNLVIQTSQELMLKETPWDADERIESLNSLLEQYLAIDQSFEDFSAQHKDWIVDESLKKLRALVSEFQRSTEDFLAQLLREQPLSRHQAEPASATPVTRKRVIKTRFRGTVVGEIRKSAPGHPVLLDVKAPLTGKVIATFHEKTPGVWLERVPARRGKPTEPRLALPAQIAYGRTQLDGLEDFIRDTRTRSKKPGRIPVEIEEIFQQKAEQLDQSVRTLKLTLAETNAVDEHPAAAISLCTELSTARERLFNEGYQTRVEMLKQQPPTAARIEWLSSKNEVDIVHSGERRRLKGPRKDFLQEYEIREHSNGQVLWYAHFHYASLDSPAESFTAAHLKLRDQRLLAGPVDVRAAASNPQVIAIYRSEISRALARSLFLGHS